jgi:chaperonin GroES
MSEAVKIPIQPLFDNVFVMKDDASTTESGLHLPQSVKGRAVTGIVVAVGPGHLNVEQNNYVPCSVKVGDKVFLREFSGSIIRYGGLEFFCFKNMEILGILREDQ